MIVLGSSNRDLSIHSSIIADRALSASTLQLLSILSRVSRGKLEAMKTMSSHKG